MPQATPKATASSAADISTLNSLVQTHLAVIDKQEKELSEIASGKRCPTKEGPEFPAFSLAKDAASLVKAQTTKLSLLIINEPFTISAIITELQRITQASYQLELAAQACDPSTYSKTIKTELASQCLDILRAWRLFLRSIPNDGRAIAKQAVESAGLASTGRLWSACDRLVALSSENGLHNHLKDMVNSNKELIKDALDELKEWGDSTGDSDDNDSVTSGDYHNYHHDPQAAIDAIMGARAHIPEDDPDMIRPRLETCTKRLRATTILYTGIFRRRMESLPALPVTVATNIPSRLDEIVPLLKQLPRTIDELACAFYDLDVSQIDQLMDSCFIEAFTLSELVAKDWLGKQDVFSGWVAQFQSKLKES